MNNWHKISDGMPSESTWCLVYGYGDYGPGIVMALWLVSNPEESSSKPHWEFPMLNDHFDAEDKKTWGQYELEGAMWNDQSHFLCINNLTHYKPIEMPDPKVLSPERYK